jgi:hypothetical protein
VVDDLDPERRAVRNVLERQVLPWLIARAFGMSEVRQAISRAKLNQNALVDHLSDADNLVITRCPEFETIFRFADRRNGRVDTYLLGTKLGYGEWPIRSGIYYETKLDRPNPTSLYDAVCDWCSVALRDSVVPELRRLINAQLPKEFATTLNVGAIPGLRRVDDVSYTVITRSTRRFLGAVRRIHGSGTIGLAGARGSGKTSMIQRYISGLHATEAEPTPMSVFVSCPVHYDARDFMLHLYAELCRTVLDRAGAWREPGPRMSTESTWPRRLWRHLVRLAGGLAVAFGVLLLVARVNLGRPILSQLVHVPKTIDWWTPVLFLVEGLALFVVGSGAAGVLRELGSAVRGGQEKPQNTQDGAATARLRPSHAGTTSRSGSYKPPRPDGQARSRCP